MDPAHQSPSDAAASPSSDSESPSDSDAGDAPPTQWLATTRQRRSTAGNRMKSILTHEEPDSDLELLFAEDENDDGFEGADDDGSDVHMDSSDDDDDEDDNPDDLEGEKELERRAKEQHLASRKRKARDAIPPKFRKKVRIDPTTPAAPPPRPKKKSERSSWLPSPADLPTRSSSRKTTRISKEHLHRQMIEREARRLKQLALMEKKAAKLEALRKPPMSQSERLAEAALVEKRNSKSLNRWEVAERQREEDRRARLAALNNRTLSGPVITFWSGVREWRDALGQHVTLVEAKPKKKRERVDKASKPKEKDAEHVGSGDQQAIAPEGQAPAASSAKDTPPEPVAENTPAADAPLSPAPNHQAPRGPNTSTQGAVSPSVLKQEETGRLMAMPAPPPPPPPLSAPSALSAASGGLATPPAASARPSSVLAAPVLAPPPGIDMDMDMDVDRARPIKAPKFGVLAPPDTSQHHAPPQVQAARPSEPPAAGAAAAPGTESKPLHASREPPPQANPGEASRVVKPASPGAAGEDVFPPQPPEPARGSTTTARNAIIFRSFDQNAIRDKAVQTQILFGRKMTRLSKPSPAAHCVITGHPARYRDPKTSLPYYNALAYREIQRLHRGEYRWSRLLGAWVGSGTVAARGVPQRFLCPESDEARRKRMADDVKDKEETTKTIPPAPVSAQPAQPVSVTDEANAPPVTSAESPCQPGQPRSQ